MTSDKIEETVPYISEGHVENVAPFGKSLKFSFDKKINIFISPNGLGKTTALREFAGVRYTRFFEHPEAKPTRIVTEPCDSLDSINRIYIGPIRIHMDPSLAINNILTESNYQNKNAVGALFSAAWPNLSSGFLLGALTSMAVALVFGSTLLDVIALPFLIGALLVMLLVNSVFFFLSAPWLLNSNSRRNLSAIRGYIASILDESVAFTSMFMFQSIHSIVLRVFGTKRLPARNRTSHVVEDTAHYSIRCAHRIAPEAFPKDNTIESVNINQRIRGVQRWFSFPRSHRMVYDHLSSIDTLFAKDRLHVSDLSSGTQGVFLIVWYIALKLAHANDFQPGWEQRPAALFIDEIENHLHPEWQRRFIPELLEAFPNLQIFATTHSPFVVAGLQPGQIQKLYRDSENNIQVERNELPTIGWTADEILHEYLEIIAPTDFATAQGVDIVRWLETVEVLLDDIPAEDWRRAEVCRLEEATLENKATREEGTVKKWLSGDSEFYVKISIPLEGNAEEWRSSMIAAWRSMLGVDLLSGGTVLRQRKEFEGGS